MMLWTANALLLLVALQPDATSAFAPSTTTNARMHQVASSLRSSASADDFAAFEASLEEDAPTTESTTTTKSSSASTIKSWTQDLDELLDITTPLSKRQSLLTNLLSANQDIRSSVESAIKGRTIDPLLTPRGKRIREGSRAVARQITSDILPELVEQNRNAVTSGTIPPFPPFPAVTQKDLEKAGNRMFNALQSRFQTDLDAMQSDIQNDPLRSIPERISKQSREILKEASNVFSETPSGLKEPPYTVVMESADYEIRDYEAYKVATTNIVDAENQVDQNDLAQSGVAFNTLVAYMFGANQQGLTVEMTTPITTTSSGEMRFYLDGPSPDPLKQDESTSAYERPGSILLQEIPPARLAVRRFSGFATKGEVARQKQALLTALAMDDVELDVPHGATVPHVVFQYNPPYTIPVLRRNEIAVAVSSALPGQANGYYTTPNGASTTGEDDDVSTSIRDSWEPVE